MNTTNLIKNTTNIDIFHNNSGINFPANSDYIYFSPNVMSGFLDDQFVNLLDSGSLVYNDGIVDYVPSEAIAFFTDSTLSYGTIYTKIRVSEMRQMEVFQSLVIEENGSLVLDGRVIIYE